MKNPPVLIAVIGFFAAMAGFAYLFSGFSMLGFDWFGLLGDLQPLENVGLWGWFAIITGLLWLTVAFGLWGLQPWARVFALVMVGIALLEAAIAFFEFPGTGIGFAMAVMPALLLWYLSTAAVKEAFGEGRSPATLEPEAAPEPDIAPGPAMAPESGAAPVAFAAVAAAAVSSDPAPEPSAAPVAFAATGATAAESHLANPPGDDLDMRIVEVEGIGPVYAEKLAAAGITTTGDLLAAGAKPSGRDRIADGTGISASLILEWVNAVDLMRVPGIGPEYSDLLEAAGVDSPAELAHRNAANLAITVQEVVAARPNIVRRIPSETEIARWIEAADNLTKVVEH